MNRNRYSMCTALLATIMLMLSACSSEQAAPAATDKGADAKGTTDTPQGAIYPFKKNVTVSYMTEFPGSEQGFKEELKIENSWQQTMEKRTGIKLNHRGGAKMNSQEFNLILASGDLPDIWTNDWLNFPGGPEKAIELGYIMKLNDVIDKYAPNLQKALKDNPEMAKSIRTDTGAYYAFPFYRSPEAQIYGGPIIRKDWLDELSLPVPATMDEWYTVLKTFKEKKGVSAPFTLRTMFWERTSAFQGAYGVMNGFYQENGKVVFGNIQPGYKQFLTTMHKWYAEGLLDKDFASIDAKTVDKKMTTNASGATVGWTNGYIDKYMDALKATEPKVELVGTTYPTLEKGQRPKFGQMDNAYFGCCSGAISGNSKNVEAAARWLDYNYSKEGQMLNMFGIEGLTYTLENGQIKYTDLITKNPEGKTPFAALSGIARITNHPFMQVGPEPATVKQAADAVKLWQNTDHAKYLLPPITQLPEESKEIAKILNEVNVLVKESEIKFILGDKPLDEFDAYVGQLKKLGVDKAVELKQKALERYQKR
ncbi:extracellular solute-binding protein [Paenibacillus periandrae]|uniref:extracellular solute-binding protein n=1 Tax=Paenibacillus periandrae TaxID=1761741 RepID=UPI001F096A70|nr:extracellular solute-binding protein [Paenibacillus periandrae]